MIDPRFTRQLFQVKPPNTAAYSVLRKAAKRKVVLLNIQVVNTTGSAAVYSIYLDKDGTTYNESTALVFNASLAANTAALHQWTDGLPMDAQTEGNIAVQVGTANAITLTGNGIEA